MSELIRYQNGVTIEVAAPQGRNVAVKESAVERIGATFDSVIRTLGPILNPLGELLAGADKHLTEAEVKLGVGFSAEGSIFVTKATAEANLEITLTFKRTPAQE